MDAVMGREATLVALKSLMARLESGEISCAALRVFRADGTWEDVVLGGDDAEKAQALADLQQQYAQLN